MCQYFSLIGLKIYGVCFGYPNSTQKKAAEANTCGVVAVVVVGGGGVVNFFWLGVRLFGIHFSFLTEKANIHY